MSEAGIAVIGAGGHGKVVIATLQAAGAQVVAVFDQERSKWGEQLLGVPVIGGTSELAAAGLTRAVLAVGDNRGRQRLADELDLDWVNAIHPTAIVHESVRIGPGTVIFAGTVVQPGVELGIHCIVNTGASVDHDCSLKDFAHVAPGSRVAGDVTVGRGALVGIGSAVAPGLRIGSWSIVGAGAAVVRNVVAGTTVTGVPAT